MTTEIQEGDFAFIERSEDGRQILVYAESDDEDDDKAVVNIVKDIDLGQLRLKMTMDAAPYHKILADVRTGNVDKMFQDFQPSFEQGGE